MASNLKCNGIKLKPHISHTCICTATNISVNDSKIKIK